MDIADEFGQDLAQKMQRGFFAALRSLNPVKLNRHYRELKKRHAFKAMAKQEPKIQALEDGKEVLTWTDKDGKPLVDRSCAYDVIQDLARNNIPALFDKKLGVVIDKDYEQAVNVFLAKKQREIERLEAQEKMRGIPVRTPEELDRDKLVQDVMEEVGDPRFDTYKELDPLDPKRALAEHLQSVMPQGPHLAPVVKEQQKRLEELLEQPELTEEMERKAEELRTKLAELKPSLERENAQVAQIISSEVQALNDASPGAIREARNLMKKHEEKSRFSRDARDDKSERENPRLDDQAKEAKEASKSLARDKEKIHERGRARIDSRAER